MANRTDPLAKSISSKFVGEDIENKDISEHILEGAMFRSYCRDPCRQSTNGGNRSPTPFMCLVTKMLQIQPDKEIVVEFIKNPDYKCFLSQMLMCIGTWSLSTMMEITRASDKEKTTLRRRKKKMKKMNNLQTRIIIEHGVRPGKKIEITDTGIEITGEIMRENVEGDAIEISETEKETEKEIEMDEEKRGGEEAIQGAQVEMGKIEMVTSIELVVVEGIIVEVLVLKGSVVVK